jgi:inner membrane protein
MRSTVLSRVPSVFLPAAATVTVGTVDLLLAARKWPLRTVAVLDESAHLLTAGLTVAAIHPRTTSKPALLWVLAGSVLLDLDHVPMYLGLDVSAGHSGGRPVTHSLATVAGLIGSAAAVRRLRLPWPASPQARPRSNGDPGRRYS